jgi:hypothetical protein
LIKGGEPVPIVQKPVHGASRHGLGTELPGNHVPPVHVKRHRDHQ